MGCPTVTTRKSSRAIPSSLFDCAMFRVGVEDVRPLLQHGDADLRRAVLGIGQVDSQAEDPDGDPRRRCRLQRDAGQLLDKVRNARPYHGPCCAEDVADLSVDDLDLSIVLLPLDGHLDVEELVHVSAALKLA